jgi:hypothetical protein
VSVNGSTDPLSAEIEEPVRRLVPPRRPGAKSARNTVSKTLGVRLPDQIRHRLEKIAAEERTTPSDAARRFITAALTDEDRRQVLGELQEVRRELLKLRTDVATALEMILIQIGKAPEPVVKKFVTEHLRR